MAMVLIAFIAPQSMAQAIKTANIEGVVYKQGTPTDGAKVSLYEWDGQKPTRIIDTKVSSDGSKGPRGTFTFTNVIFYPDKPLAYCISAEKENEIAYVLVYMYPNGQLVSVAPVKIDVAKGSWKSDLSGAVLHGTDKSPAFSAKVTVYERDPVNGTKTKATYITPAITDDSGQYMLSDVPYGYYTIEAENNGMMGSQDIVVYKQETATTIVLDKKAATPVPSGKPTIPASNGTSSGGFGLGIPGFEIYAAILALLGVAFYLRKE